MTITVKIQYNIMKVNKISGLQTNLTSEISAVA